MSADDWIPCPFCSKKYQDEISDLNARLKRDYEVKTAKEYDELRAQVRNRIQRLEDEQHEKAYARIDGTSDYGFNEQGEFSIGIGAYCPHCERTWGIDATAKPKSKMIA